MTFKERSQIEALKFSRKSITEIAKLLNRPKSTISREIKRGLAMPGQEGSAIIILDAFFVSQQKKKNTVLLNPYKIFFFYSTPKFSNFGKVFSFSGKYLFYSD